MTRGAKQNIEISESLIAFRPKLTNLASYHNPICIRVCAFVLAHELPLEYTLGQLLHFIMEVIIIHMETRE